MQQPPPSQQLQQQNVITPPIQIRKRTAESDSISKHIKYVEHREQYYDSTLI